MAAATEGWKRSGLIHGEGILTPSGQYRVGCTTLMHKFPDDTRTLLVRLFYPCQEGGNHQYMKWVPHRRYAKGYLEYNKSKLPGLLSALVGVFTDPRIPALSDAPLFTGKPTATCTEEVNTAPDENEGVNAETSEATPSADPSVFPVIVYSHGLGAMSMTYSGICCDVASHGYVVASVEHRDRSACVSRLRVPKPRGREGELVDEWLEHYFLKEGEAEFPVRNEQVKKRAEDARRALDLLGLLNEGSAVGNLLGVNFDFRQFKGRLDLDVAGIMGHSFGGATTIQTLSEDQRFKCGVCLDTWMFPIHKELYENGPAVQQPLIFINSYNFQWKENIQQMTQMTRPPNAEGRILTLIGTNHFYQTDILSVFPQWMSSTPTSTLDIVTGHRVNMDITHAFLKRHLLQDPAFQGPIPNLDGCEGHSEHILFGSNVDITEPQETDQTPSEEVTKDKANDEHEVAVEVTSEGTQNEDRQEAVNNESNDQAEKAATKEVNNETDNTREEVKEETEEESGNKPETDGGSHDPGTADSEPAVEQASNPVVELDQSMVDTD